MNTDLTPADSALRASALFVSALQRADEPSAGQVRQAVAAAVRAWGRPGCAAQVAQEYGDHPDIAAARMRWARTLADQAFGGAAAEPVLAAASSRLVPAGRAA